MLMKKIKLILNYIVVKKNRDFKSLFACQNLIAY